MCRSLLSDIIYIIFSLTAEATKSIRPTKVAGEGLFSPVLQRDTARTHRRKISRSDGDARVWSGLSGAVANHLNQHHRALSRVWTIHARSVVTGHRVPRTTTAVPLSSLQRDATATTRRAVVDDVVVPHAFLKVQRMHFGAVGC